LPSSYTASARFVLQATGEGNGVWGSILNAGAFNLIDFAINGTVAISASGATTLTTANGAVDQARGAVLNYTGAGDGVLTIPSVSKVYQCRAATAALTITNGSNSVVIAAGNSATVATDGTSVWFIQLRDLGGQKITNLASPTAATDAASKAYVDAQAFAPTIPAFPALAGNKLNALMVNLAENNVGWVRPVPAPSRKTTTYTALDRDRLECDTTGGTFTVTLPASPVEGNKVTVWDGGARASTGGFTTNTLTIANGGSTINGASDTVEITTKGATITFEYTNATWRVHLGDC